MTEYFQAYRSLSARGVLCALRQWLSDQPDRDYPIASVLILGFMLTISPMIFIGIIYCIFLGYRRGWHVLRPPTLVVAIPLAYATVALLVISPVWMGTSHATLASLFGLAWVLSVWVRAFTVESVVAHLKYATLLCTIIAVLMIFEVIPWRSTTVHLDGSWRGFMGHKNLMAPFPALFVVLLVCDVAVRRTWPRIWEILALALCVYFVYSSNARAVSISIVSAIAFAAAVAILFRISRFGRIVALVGVLTTVAGTIYLSFHPQVFLRSTTELGIVDYLKPHKSIYVPAILTGRTEIWAATIEAGSASQPFGLGYGATLRRVNHDDILYQVIVRNRARGGWNPSHPHNGFLGAYAELGIVGLVVFVTAFVVIALIGILFRPQLGSTRWPLFIVWAMWLPNCFTEITLLQRSLWDWQYGALNFVLMFVTIAAVIGSDRSHRAAVSQS